MRELETELCQSLLRTHIQPLRQSNLRWTLNPYSVNLKLGHHTWEWIIMFRFAKYLDFLHCNIFKKNIIFSKLNPLPPSDMWGYLISWLWHKKLFSAVGPTEYLLTIPLADGNRSSFENCILFCIWKVLKCGAGEGWRRSVGPIMWEMKKCYLESMSRGISYMK